MLFRLFVWRFSRPFVFSPGIFSLRKDKETPRKKYEKPKDATQKVGQTKNCNAKIRKDAKRKAKDEKKDRKCNLRLKDTSYDSKFSDSCFSVNCAGPDQIAVCKEAV